MDLQDALKNLTDPRVERNRRHLLEDILILNANTWTEVENFGHAKYHWLKTFLALPNGTPSRDTLGRVFARLDPEGFRQCFIRWLETVAQPTQGEVVAIDGKRLRHS